MSATWQEEWDDGDTLFDVSQPEFLPHLPHSTCDVCVAYHVLVDAGADDLLVEAAHCPDCGACWHEPVEDDRPTRRVETVQVPGGVL